MCIYIYIYIYIFDLYYLYLRSTVSVICMHQRSESNAISILCMSHMAELTIKLTVTLIISVSKIRNCRVVTIQMKLVLTNSDTEAASEVY